MKNLYVYLFLLCAPGLLAQGSEAAWKYTAVTGVAVNQVALSNWAQGGENSIAYTLTGKFSADRTAGAWVLTNGLKLAYGRTKLGDDEFRTNDNEFFLESVLSYNAGWKINPYLSNTVRTTLTKGFDYKANPVKQTAGFFDPGYVTQSIGFNYVKEKVFNTRLGLAFQETFTNVYRNYSDDPETKTELEAFKLDTGIESVTSSEMQIDETSIFATSLRLFSRFNSLDVWDVRWDNTVSSKISKYFTVNFNVLVLYEKKMSPKTQLKEGLQFGITYTIL